MEDKVDPGASGNLSQERLTPSSNVRYEIFYSPHGNLGDFQGLFKLISNADIYVPEVHGWSEAYLGIYNDVSFGKKTPEQAIREAQTEPEEMNPLLLEELQTLHNSNIPVVFIDLPEEEVPWGKNKIAVAARDFEGLLENVQFYLEKESVINQKREDHMFDQLKIKVGEIIESHPNLKLKDDVSVLISLGSMHTNFYHRLKESEDRVEREFNVMPQIYAFTDEGIRSYMHGKPVSPELAARILLERVFSEVFESDIEKASSDNTKIELFKRKVVSQFSLDEIRNIFHLLTYTDWNYFKGSFEANMRYLLEEKGLKIPQSEQELEDIIKRK